MSSGFLWPSADMDFLKVENDELRIEIKWSLNLFNDYKDLSYSFYACGYQVLLDVIKSGHNNIKSDAWILPGIFLLRHSMELGIKSLLCRVCTKKRDIQDAFIAGCHDLTTLWRTYEELNREHYLKENEKQWLVTYLESLELIDSRSDMFRFPFDDDFLSRYRDKFIDNLSVAKNMLQAFELIQKCMECGPTSPFDEFDETLPPEFFSMASHGIGNCHFWQPLSEDGFHVKVTGYMQVSDFIFQSGDLTTKEKVYPLLFILRNTIELCLKRLFYSRVENGVPKHIFLSKRKSHLIKKDLWVNVKPIIQYYEEATEPDIELIDIVEQMLYLISDIDKNGDIFRYPTSYCLEYKFNDKTLDLNNVYEYMRSLINFLDGCDTMLKSVVEFEDEMRSYY